MLRKMMWRKLPPPRCAVRLLELLGILKECGAVPCMQNNTASWWPYGFKHFLEGNFHKACGLCLRLAPLASIGRKTGQGMRFTCWGIGAYFSFWLLGMFFGYIFQLGTQLQVELQQVNWNPNVWNGSLSVRSCSMKIAKKHIANWTTNSAAHNFPVKHAIQ